MSDLIKKLNYLEFSLSTSKGNLSEIIIIEGLYSHSFTNNKSGKTEKTDFSKIDSEKLSNLIAELNSITLPKWKRYYTNYYIVNAIEWNLQIHYNDNKTIKRYFGRNEFPIPTVKPSPFHPNSSTSYTPEFKILLMALNKFLGKKTFFK